MSYATEIYVSHLERELKKLGVVLSESWIKHPAVSLEQECNKFKILYLHNIYRSAYYGLPVFKDPNNSDSWYSDVPPTIFKT